MKNTLSTSDYVLSFERFEIGQNYEVFREWEQDDGTFFLECDFGLFSYVVVDDNDDNWLDKSIHYTSRRDFLENGWIEINNVDLSYDKMNSLYAQEFGDEIVS